MNHPSKPTGRRYGIDRRAFLEYIAAVSAIPTLAVQAAEPVGKPPRFDANPFTLGVASGDPEPDGVVIWTRLAPRPLDGGGMPNVPVPTEWEVATDEAFANVVRRGTAMAMPQLGHSVHVEVDGLESHRWYFYRFHAGSETSPVGRTRTAPALHTMPDRLRFAFTSCQHYEYGYFNGYPHMQQEDLDLVIHLGDYIYEYAASDKRTRQHIGGEIVSLDDYRTRLAHATGAGRDDAAAQAAGPDRCSPLAELLAHIEAHAMDSAEGVATPPGVPGELKSVRQFRRTWSRLNADRQLSRALDQAPENAGPLNSHHLVLQTLKQMRAISPEYVEQFISWVDALLWLEQADAGRGSATKSAPAGEAAKKRKPTRRKGG